MREFKVELVKAEIDLPKRGTLILLGDNHHGNQSIDEILLERKVVKHIKKHPEYRVCLNGDIIDNPQLSKLPDDKIVDLEDCLHETEKRLSPIFEQIVCVDWGNHEERTFREPFGKGIAPNVLYGHFSLAQKIQEKNPDVVYAPLMRGVHMNIITPIRTYNIMMKHGFRAGLTADFKEFYEILRLYQDIDQIWLNHTHRPFVAPFCKINDDGTLKTGWFVRGGTFTSWKPYQEKKNLSPSPISYVEVQVKKGLLRMPKVKVI